jgi:hypothetical protein
MNKHEQETYAKIAVIIVFFLGLILWGVNIAKLMQLDEVTGETIIRTIGVVIPPLGAILGLF